MTHCMRCVSPASCDVWGCVPGTFSGEKHDLNPQPLTLGQQAILDAIPLRQPGPFDLSTSAVPAAPGAPVVRFHARAMLNSHGKEIVPNELRDSETPLR